MAVDYIFYMHNKDNVVIITFTANIVMELMPV